MDRATDVLLVGGGAASVRCCRTLRREAFDGSILIVGDEADAPYNRPPLSKELLRDDLPDELIAVEATSWYERRRVGLLTGVAVTRLDLDARVASLSDGSTVRFERCLLATGAEPITLPVPGADHGLPLRTLADARRLRRAATEAVAGATVVVVGGGFIGVEVASALAALGLRPILIERGSALWGGALGVELSAWAVGRLAAAGVEVRLNTGVTRLGASDAWCGEERVAAAFTVVGIGVRPRVELAADAGLVVDDGILTDAGQRTSHPAVWAAGDVARPGDRRVEHWHAARESGERAARSMLDLEVPPVPVPWFFSEVAGTSLDVVGAATAWDDERWVVPHRLLAQISAERVSQLAIIGSALPADAARRLVAERATVAAVEEVAQ